jgi:hypothetical protein
VSSDVGKTVVNFDELKVAGRDEWGGEREAKFVEATLDPAHRAQPNWLMAVFSQPGSCHLLPRGVRGRVSGDCSEEVVSLEGIQL